ncbi:uncharacterized protein LOC122368905 [Amphibalanus amphitrite]|uniref:uncharacterized protein LOC122368905 n=1 Tax=Amphibalanus amphitrite TaxID=1232801 RepID=UPI001C90BCAC|nr:uncharacterized protein LOC122368905 [Amphibalanus amphitrite]
MLDTGSNQSFVTSAVADQLHCQQLALDDMNVQSFGGGQTKQKMRKVQISLKGLCDGTPPLAITAYVVPTICSSPPRAEPAIRRHAHLKGLQLAEPVTLEGEDHTISVLIGQDYMREVIDGRMKIGTAGPIALGSRFGWIISGPSGSGKATQAATSNFIRAEKAEDLLQDLWSLEKVGISTEESDGGKDRIRCDDEVKRSFEETLERLPNGRHHLKLYEQSDPKLVTLLKRDIYCDDLITSVDTEEEAEEVKARTQYIFLDAGMVMTKWDRSASGETAERNIGDCGETDRKVLGVTWQPASDVLEMCTRTLAEYAAALPETKRTILKIAAAFYDPLGLMAAFSWPARYEDEEVPADCTVEQEKQEVSVNACSTAEDVAGIGQLVPLENYSSLKRLHRVTAWVIRWTKKARREEDTAGELTQEEIRRSGDLWVAQAQTDAFKDEKARLQSGQDVPGTSDVFHLNPHLNNGFLRVTGRLQESELTAQEKYPLILPSKHRYTKLVILDLHENLCHAGIQQTMFALRSRFWVPRSRQTVRQTIHGCARCRVFRLKPLSQERAPLPKERVCGGAPFSRIGVDLGGPLYFKDGEKSEPVKAYFVLFTCTAVRAVHLELVETLSTEDFLAAFERFVARRGKPTVVFSDNATNFRGAASRLTHLGVTWKFNVPRAPWWGGFFERMVRTTKDALRKTLYKSLMTFSELQTVLCRIESVINARPLSPLTEDINDVRTLSPDDFLRDTSHESAERAATDHPETDGEPGRSLGARWRYRRQVLQHLWQRWAREYVRELRVPRREPNDQPKVGDMVLIGDNTKTSPALWQMGKITQLHQGRDGLTRSATVRTAGGELARPVQRLYPLEAT